MIFFNVSFFSFASFHVHSAMKENYELFFARQMILVAALVWACLHWSMIHIFPLFTIYVRVCM